VPATNVARAGGNICVGNNVSFARVLTKAAGIGFEL